MSVCKGYLLGCLPVCLEGFVQQFVKGDNSVFVDSGALLKHYVAHFVRYTAFLTNIFLWKIPLHKPIDIRERVECSVE